MQFISHIKIIKYINEIKNKPSEFLGV